MCIQKKIKKLRSIIGLINDKLTWEFSTRLFWAIVAAISVLSLLTVIFSVKTSAGYNDEAWLALMVQNTNSGFWTSFAWYYRFMSSWGLAEMRATVAIIHGIACAVFVAGIAIYYRLFKSQVFLHSLGLWAITAFLHKFFWLGSVVLAPDYKFISFDAALIGAGFFFPGLKKPWLLVLSGFFFIQILFTLPPAAALAPLLLIIIWLKGMRHFSFFVLGGIIGIAIFFACVQPWTDFAESFFYSSGRLTENMPGRHGVKMLITGYIKIILSYAGTVLPAALALFAVRRNSDKPQPGLLALVLGTIFCVFILSTLRVLSWNDSGCPAFSVLCFQILFCYTAFKYIDEFDGAPKFRSALLASIFIVLPTLFCTGTDKGFENRLTFYMGVIFAGSVIFGYLTRDRLLIICMTLFVTLGFFAGCIYWRQHGNFTLKPQTFNALQAGLPNDAPISLSMAEHLKVLKKYTDKCIYVANDPEHWYVPYLLNKKPLHLTSFRYYYFDNLPAMIAQKNIQPGDILFFESPTYALPDKKLDTVKKTLNATSVERIIISENHHILSFK